MKRAFLRKKSYLMLCLLLFTVLASCNVQNKEQTKPNIIFILADDLGYGELGCYGQDKIETPNIDQLAAEGMKFTNFYAGAPVCAPSRCVLLTGKHLGHAYVRGNDEWAERGNVWSYEAMAEDENLEGQRPLPSYTENIASMLKKSGYKTGIIGKWGLGAPLTNATPNDLGFDYFFGYNCQRQAHTYYPLHLYENKERVYLRNDTVAPNTKLDKDADPMDIRSYNKYTLEKYSPDLMFDNLISFVEQSKSEPFFLYWASPLPHVPLQAPKRLVDYYHEKFGDEEPYLGNKGYFPCRYPKATYAAMVTYLDERVGQLVKKLKDEGIYDNTIIMFSSDNGPTFNGGTQSEWFKSAGEYFRAGYGYGKCFVYEGGLRVPLIVSYPGHTDSASVSNHIGAFYDVLPTLAELTGSEVKTYTDGISFLPSITNIGKQKEHEFLYWEFNETGGQIAVRMGNWKGVVRQMQKGNKHVELYSLIADPGELNDVSADHPELVEKFWEIVHREHAPSWNPKWQFSVLEDGLASKYKK
ncbi:MAG: arylsulfatase [Bacteroidales bacterium]